MIWISCSVVSVQCALLRFHNAQSAVNAHRFLYYAFLKTETSVTIAKLRCEKCTRKDRILIKVHLDLALYLKEYIGSHLKPITLLLPLSYFQHKDVVHLAQDLIGKILITETDGIQTSGIIVETEAYRGADDRACHAFNYKRTARTETMFLEGGHAYVYLCYGIHSLFNIVVNREGEPDAVLIRALEPLEGIKIMKERRPKSKNHRITSGPGCLTKAMGISLAQNALPLISSNGIWLEEPNSPTPDFKIEARTRIGVDYAGEDAKRLWRFLRVGGNSEKHRSKP